MRTPLKNISIIEVDAVERIYTLLAQCYNTADTFLFKRDIDLLKNIYLAYRYAKSAHEIMFPAMTHHNTSLKGADPLKSRYLVDDTKISSFGCLDIDLKNSSQVDLVMHKHIIVNLINIEDSALCFLNSIGMQKESFLELIALCRVNCIEARFMLDLSLELNYKERVDLIN